MIVLPIVQRELRVMANRAGVRWVRVAFAAVAFFLCFQWFEASSYTRTGSSAGLAIFHVLARAAFLFAFGAGFLAAETLNTERREGTLGLLFLTDLKTHEVVFGKFVSSGANAIYALIAITPILMLMLFLGGVSAGEVTRTALALLGMMFVSLATGLLIASRFSGRIQTLSATALALFASSLLPWVPKAIWPNGSLYVEMLSPPCAFFKASDASAAAEFWCALIVTICEGALLLAAASVSLLKHCHDAGKLRRVRSSHERRRFARARPFLNSDEMPEFAKGLRTISPVAYAVLRMPCAAMQMWVAASLMVLAALLSAPGAARIGTPMAWAGASAVLWFAAAGIFATVAGRFFFEGRRNGELELLLPTPLGANGIVRDQWLALKRLLQKPVLLVAFGTVPYAAVMVVMSPGMELAGLLASLLFLANQALGVIAACAVGMWFGLRAKRPIAVGAWTVVLVEFVPTVLAYLVAFFAAANVNPFRVRDAIVIWSLLLPGLLIVKNLLFIGWAHHRLCSEFHAPGFWKIMRWFDERSGAAVPQRMSLAPPRIVS